MQLSPIKCLLLCTLITQSSFMYSYSFVFVHLGKALPTYLADAMEQARLFNPACDIYLIASQEALADTPPLKDQCKTIFITTESLKKTREHNVFLQKNKLHEPFWLYTCERFLYLHDFMQQYSQTDVLHIENDVMVYTDFSAVIPIFKQHYKGIAAVFDNDDRCIASFMYIANKNAMAKLANYFAQHAHEGKFDMQLVAGFKQKSPISDIDSLPIITQDYIRTTGLKSTSGLITKKPAIYCNHIEQFTSIFDAAAIGQYLGGNDPIHRNAAPGFINESCLFNVADCTYTWELDTEGRRVPYLVFNDTKIRINNLHIHSKNLVSFKS